jgi:hypothetical protein
MTTVLSAGIDTRDMRLPAWPVETSRLLLR